ncbi:hypothetical protein HA402_011958 [Bradysia odoriphaga]|nr:hypothetical protein HA402_011958 [Bradysia odoriphaga]
MRNYFLDYCSNATIHGVRYFTERRRHWTERCWWIVAIIMAACFCGISIQNVWIKWRDSPVIMNMNEKMIPISTIPFPTITICPEVKTRKGKLDLSSYAEEKNISEIKITRAKALAHVCTHFNEFVDENDDFTDGSVFDVIKDIAPVFNETISTCEWHYHDISCEKWFVPILTEEGHCFAFNALNSIDVYTENMAPEMMTVWNRPKTDWSPDDGYVNVADKKTYPIHVYSARDSAKLTITLRSDDEDIEYVCRSLTPGYKIFFHTPSNVLRATDAFVPVNLGGGVNIAFKPKLITTSDGLRKYQPNQRQCFFNSERQLHFYRFYSQENCQAECLANYTVLQLVQQLDVDLIIDKFVAAKDCLN